MKRARWVSLAAMTLLPPALAGALWIVRRLANRDLAGLLGTVAIWAALLSAAGVCVICALEPPGDRAQVDELFRRMGRRRRQLFWPLTLGLGIAPGFWIGFSARSPLPVVAAALGIWEAVSFVCRITPPLTEATPVGRRLENLLIRAVALLVGTAAAEGVRALMR